MTPPRQSAGYSGTPLAKKLGIKPGSVVSLLAEPDHFRQLLEPIPDDVTFRTSLRGNLDLVIAFFTARSPFASRLPALARAIYPDAGLWVSWPKKTSPLAGDLNENVVRELGLAEGIVDIKVCAIDEDWSGLRFAHRLVNR